MRMEDDVDAPDDVDLDGDVDMGRNGNDDKEEDEEEEDEQKENEEEVEEEDEDEEEDMDEDDGKEPRTIGQGEMVNTSADDADTMVDDEPPMLLEQGQEMREHSPRPQPPAPSPLPQTPEPPPQPRTQETYTQSGLKFLVLVTPQKRRPAAPTLREAEAARNTSAVDVEQQLLGESASGYSLPDADLPDVPLPDVPLPDVPLPDASVPDVPLPHVPVAAVSLAQARPDGSVGEEWTSPRVAAEACIQVGVGFISCEFPLLWSIHLGHWFRHAWRCFVRLGYGCGLVCFICSNLFISGIDYYTRRKVFGSLRVYFLFIHSIMGHRTCSVLQLLAWWCGGSINLSNIVSLYPHQTAKAELQLSSVSTVNTPLLPCCRQCQRRPHSVAPNCHAKRSSPATAGDLIISKYYILNTFNLQTIWLFAARPNALNLLSVMNSLLSKIQSKTWTRFPTLNTLKTLQTPSLNQRHLLYHGRKHTPAPALRWAITLLSHGNATLRVASRRTYQTISPTCLRRVKSTNISSVWSRRRVWTRTMTTGWR